MTREVTLKLYEMMDEGVLDARTVANAALAYFSEDDIAAMAHANELIIDDEEEEVEDIDDDMDGDHESALTSAGWGVDESYGGFDGE